MSRLSDAIDRWVANNARASRSYNGKLYLPWFEDFNSTILNGYLKADQGEFSDPDGSKYEIAMMGYWGHETSFEEPEEFDHTIYISGGVKCNGENLAQKENIGSTGYVIQYKLEGGGKVCVDNNNSAVYVPRPE